MAWYPYLENPSVSWIELEDVRKDVHDAIDINPSPQMPQTVAM
jgi:hypothetical protein